MVLGHSETVLRHSETVLRPSNCGIETDSWLKSVSCPGENDLLYACDSRSMVR